MLSTRNLGKSYGARNLFSKVTLELNVGSRYGLVGANGSGKSTLLNIMLGNDAPSEGAVVIAPGTRVGSLKQDRFDQDALRIIDVACAGDELVWRALTEQRAIQEPSSTHALSSEQAEQNAIRYSELEELIRAHDGYTLEARASWILSGLGIAPALHRDPLGTLSGGFKLRVLLAQALLGGPELLLLDEPTNHLDILSIQWLQEFLSSYQGCAVVISHDQWFLDNVVTHILDVDYETVTTYVGNYSAFAREKQAIRARKESEIAKTEAVIAHKRAYVERFRYKASKASQAQSILKQLDKIEVEELDDSSRRSPTFAFTQKRPSGKDVLTLDKLCKSYGSKRVLTDITVTLRRGEKLAVIGANGLGKSTLLRIIANTLKQDSGAVVWGHETHVGYFAQDHQEILDDPDATAFEVMDEVLPKEGQGVVRSYLGRVLFSANDVFKPVKMLSGGEAARLVFGTLMAKQPNVLILDEPTNHLDLESIDALMVALKAFEGTIIFVSHDRRFVSEIATRVLELTDHGPQLYPGTYDEYLAHFGNDHLSAEAVVLRAKSEKSKTAAKVPVDRDGNPLSWEEKKRRRNRLQQLPKLRDKALTSMETAEARIKQIDAMYATDGFFERTTPAELRALEQEQTALKAQADKLLHEWESLESELAELSAPGAF
jgi:ATPase subunit of ABC transporter with duplicated ATPase domains